jgi:hypothetical protein
MFLLKMLKFLTNEFFTKHIWLKEKFKNFLVVELEFSNYYSTNMSQTYQPKFSIYCNLLH